MKSRSRFKSILFWCFYSALFHIFLYQIFTNIAPVWAWGRSSGRQTSFFTYQEVLVRYRSEASLSDIGNSYNSLGLNEVAYSPYSGLRRVRVPSTISVYSVSANLNQNPLVDIAEPNYIRTANFIPNDPLYQYQWHINNPMMQQTWDQSVGTNIVVAVFDTGIAYRDGGGYALAPDLAATNFMPGYDFVNDDQYPDDDNRHGTHTAGVIAQSTNNLFGGAGVAPDCILMPVKVLDDSGAGSVAGIVDAIYFAVNNGAQIINMSYGFVTSPSASEEEAINYAVSQGITVICSAGNEATYEPHYPSSYEAAICVTASRYDHSFADTYSNYGPDVDICAPGGDLDEDVNGDGYPDGIYQQTHNGTNYSEFDYYFAEGTSCAAAFVSGVAALILARAARPLTPAEVREILETTATDFGEPGWDQFYGWGLLNPLGAVQAAVTYSAASSFGPRIGSQSINPFIAQSTNLYQNSTPSSYPNTNSSALQTNNSQYQANAGFVSVGQPINQSYQPINPQINAPYAPITGYLPNNQPSINTYSLGNNLLFAPFLPSSYFFPQNPFSTSQNSVANGSYNISSSDAYSSGYQIESNLTTPFLPYRSQTLSSPTINPFIPSSFTNALFFQRFYPYWFY